MSPIRSIPLYRRWLAGVLAALLGLGPLATPAYAAVTLLADQPLNAQSKAKPNIMLTIDDSTSMLYDFLPDSVIGNYCRDATGAMAAACGVLDQNRDFSAVGRGKYQSGGYIYEQYGMPFGAYDNTFDTSGPGAGCVLGASPTCSGGIDPGPSPGIERYPNPGSPPMSPKAGSAYEYWTLWPAPVHNSELNHSYYNPRLNYQPPIDASGASYPQMNATNTTSWTRVPADPWAPTIQYVDLTARVTIGLWCNSDWSAGHESDPAYCRTNGTGGTATTSSMSTVDGDYNYPWAPPGVNPAMGTSTALSVAYSKVVPATYALQPNWSNGTLKDSKYYYENDNTLWCDATSSLWPQTATPGAQTCTGASANPQVCVGRSPQACVGGAPQTCVAGAANACAGATPQTCGTLGPQTCGGAVTQTCNGATAQTCAGVGNQTCGGITSQTCNGVTPQTCGSIAGQTCNGIVSQTCNIPTAACVYGVCAGHYDPPGCDTCTSECGACSFVTTCPTGNCSTDNSICTTAATCPTPGTCSNTGASCASTAQCPNLPGTCSADGASCTSSASCATAGKCSTNVLQTCHVDTDCATIPGNCSIDNASCMSSATCGNEGHCTLTGAVCASDATCLAQPGHCTITNASCFDDTTCLAAGGICSATGTACVDSTLCPTVVGGCSIDAAACTTTGDCLPASTCSVTHTACHSNGECPTLSGACTLGGGCTTDLDCPVTNHCSTTGSVCSSVADCPDTGKTCSVTGEVCASASFCQAQGGHCEDVINHPGIDTGPCTTKFVPPGIDIATCPSISVSGHCSEDIANVCTSDADCGSNHGPAGSATCSDALSDNSHSLRYDADHTGLVCRHNNQAYGATTSASPFNYPDARYNVPVTAGTGADACAASPRYATVPRHYWKTSVEWCDQAVGTAGDKWLGYGTTTGGGTCQDSPDATHNKPRFYQFGQPAGTSNDTTPAFQRMDLDIAKRSTATYVHDWTDDNGAEHVARDFDGATPDVSEMTNYANWFAYYRTRIQATKTITSIVFNAIDVQYRVGFHNLFKLSSFVNIKDFDAAQRSAWYSQLFGVDIPLGQQTPSLDALVRIGEYFTDGTAPGLSGATDPIQLSCQKNWHMFFTDGYTNQSGVPAVTADDLDNVIPNYPDSVTKPIPGLLVGQPWPAPFREDPLAGASNALSDYAMKYWITDLRTSGPNATNNVPFSTSDPAQWQHLNFAALSLGTSGKLPAGNQSVTESALAAGSLLWPQPYPNVYQPDNSGVDDLWHAAVNGRGRFVNAQTPEEVALGMGQILQDVLTTSGTRTTAGFQTNTLGAASDIVYRVLFEPGWSGSLAKLETHATLVAGTVKAIVTGVPDWEASARLNTRLQITAAKPTPWFSERNIITRNETGTAVPFLWANIGPNQKDSLAPGNALRGQNVLEFLRGNRQKEGTKLGQLRTRTSPLGDIVDSSPVYVGVPGAPYTDGNDPGYSAFVASLSGGSARAPRIYVGANDGMMHAFDDATGNETWAYIPSPLFRGGSAGGDKATGLGALAYQDGALPPFRHHYYVDATPNIVDVDLNAPAGDTWRTLLVAGLGKGGNRYFALDVTQPTDIHDNDEATAATKALWEWPPVGNTAFDIGYSYGKPMIAKTRGWGGRWVVIVASGYDNIPSVFPSGTGKGNLFILDAADGHMLKTMTTNSGDAGSPSGLAHLSGYTQDFKNQLVDQVYGADLDGNLWRFDMLDANPNNWTVGKFARLVDGGGAAQPVTTPPEIKIDVQNGIDRWVFVGTGKLYDDSDVPAPPATGPQQTMYAFRDGTASAPLPIPATPLARTTAGMVPLTHAAANKFGLATKPAIGWYDDLPAGQRIVVPPRASVGTVAYVATASFGDPCLLGLPAFVYAREYSTGQSELLDPSAATDTPIEAISSPDGGVGLAIVTFPGSTGAGDFPDIRLAITLPTGEVIYFKANVTALPFGHRMSWRLLSQ